MFNPDKDDLDYLVGKYGGELTAAQRALMIAILKMSPAERTAVDHFIDEVIALRKS
jgi:hypothetical protein